MALVRSINIAPVDMLLPKEDETSLVNFRRAVVVENLGLKPDWLGDRMEKSLIYLNSWLNISFSNTFAILLMMEMGLFHAHRFIF